MKFVESYDPSYDLPIYEIHIESKGLLDVGKVLTPHAPTRM